MQDIPCALQEQPLVIQVEIREQLQQAVFLLVVGGELEEVRSRLFNLASIVVVLFFEVFVVIAKACDFSCSEAVFLRFCIHCVERNR